MGLSQYKKMRRFAETPEPAGGEATRGRPIFVVQLHHASHRHYDFRLEHDGVLKSWSVPKGPSFDPSVKRLAVQVEDHPIDYATFEGIIPEGNYGAGDVRVFDHGTWSCDGDIDAELRKGHLHFTLDGDKLRGAWDLIRTGGRGPKPQWLLKKVQDDEAGPFESDDLLGDPEDYELPEKVWHSNRDKSGALKSGTVTRAPGKATNRLDGAKREHIDATFFAPELARATESPPEGDDWIHEPKWDGYRLLTAVGNGKVRLWSRNGIEWTARVPHVVDAIASLGASSLRLDGELVAMHESGKVSTEDFNSLQATLAGESNASLRYVVFDLLHADGLDLSRMPIEQRKTMLHALVAQLRGEHAKVVVEGEHVVGGGKALYDELVKQGYEGVVSKRAGSPYRAGRGDDWKKCRARDAEELAVVGFTKPRGSRAGIGALLMGRARKDGGWDYAGRVGTGMGHALLVQLAEELPKLARDAPTVHEDSLVMPKKNGDLRGVTWVRPQLTVEVEFHGRGKGGLLRQPSVKALRLDKRAGDLVPEGDARSDHAPSDRAPSVRVTHPERVVYPGPGYTKGDVFAYYAAVADVMLPELARRPLAIVRCPAGALGKSFFQKHVKPGFGPDVHAGSEDYLWVDSDKGLLELAQMNALELHAWGCHVDDIEGCDRLVLDLDPAEDVPWKRVVETAQGIRRSLEAMGLQSFVRLSGGKGVHIVVPLDPVASFADAKGFAGALASAMAKQAPDEIIDVMTKAHRGGKIFIDYLRNGRGATSVASYSLRKNAEATVSMPIEWSELGKVSGPKAFDLKSALARVKKRKKDPWAELGAVKQALPRLK